MTLTPLVYYIPMVPQPLITQTYIFLQETSGPSLPFVSTLILPRYIFNQQLDSHHIIAPILIMIGVPILAPTYAHSCTFTKGSIKTHKICRWSVFTRSSAHLSSCFSCCLHCSSIWYLGILIIVWSVLVTINTSFSLSNYSQHPFGQCQ